MQQPETSQPSIAVITKNRTQELHVRLGEYCGSSFVDLRLFSPVSGIEGLHPTKKGVALNVNKIDELIAGLEQAKVEAIRKGLLSSGEDDA